jgi:hypothetical protein
MDPLSPPSSSIPSGLPREHKYTQEEWNEWKLNHGWQALDARHQWYGNEEHKDDAEARYATVEVQRVDVPEDVACVLKEMDAIHAEFEMWPRSNDGQ